MARRREAAKRSICPDPKYGDRRVAKFTCVIMRGGKKSIAESIVYGALEYAGHKAKADPLKVFEQALENVKPTVKVQSRRFGGSNLQVPREVRPEQRSAWAFRWLRDFAKQRGEHSMKERLGAELFDASQGRGGACKKREDTHRMAEANKAFAHYRW